MLKILSGLLIILLSPNLFATVYKCVNGENIIFSQSPCQGKTKHQNKYKPKEGSIITTANVSPSKSVSKNRHQSKRAMAPLTAIGIRNTKCHQSQAGKVTYTGMLYNLSSNDTYSALIAVQYKFKLYKKDNDFVNWDQSAKRFKLHPNKSYPFSITSNRILPDDSSADCESHLTAELITST